MAGDWTTSIAANDSNPSRLTPRALKYSIVPSAPTASGSTAAFSRYPSKILLIEVFVEDEPVEPLPPL
jgi:hypothetical protein